MRDLSAETFRQHLSKKYSLPARARARVERPQSSLMRRCANCGGDRSVAANSPTRCPAILAWWRLSLPQLLAATPCLDGFSRRFLRDSTIFPFRARTAATASRSPTLDTPPFALRDVFGEPVEVAVASFEDITPCLTSASRRRRRRDEVPGIEPAIRRRYREPARSRQRRARGRALNDLLERPSSCAPATSTSSRSAPVWWSACASTAVAGAAAP